MRIEFVGADKLNAKLKEMYKKIPTEFSRFLTMEAEVVKARTKGLTPVDYGRLRDSWSSTVTGTTAEIFTNVEYGGYVEFGHRIKPGWVPGSWQGNHFRYQPGAKTGMLLKGGSVEGRHMLRDAVDGSAGSFAADAQKILARIFS